MAMLSDLLNQGGERGSAGIKGDSSTQRRKVRPREGGSLERLFDAF